MLLKVNNVYLQYPSPGGEGSMASTSSHIKANWFFSFKKAQNPPLVDIFIF